ncbi:hypothetical protein AOLI_G00185070 [Acnodon oligacanthus]
MNHAFRGEDDREGLPSLEPASAMNQSHSDGLLSTVCTDHQLPLPGYYSSSSRKRKERIRTRTQTMR